MKILYLIKNHIFDIVRPVLSVWRNKEDFQTLRDCNKNLWEKFTQSLSYGNEINFESVYKKLQVSRPLRSEAFPILFHIFKGCLTKMS